MNVIRGALSRATLERTRAKADCANVLAGLAPDKSDTPKCGLPLHQRLGCSSSLADRRIGQEGVHGMPEAVTIDAEPAGVHDAGQHDELFVFVGQRRIKAQ